MTNDLIVEGADVRALNILIWQSVKRTTRHNLLWFDKIDVGQEFQGNCLLPTNVEKLAKDSKC